MIYLKIKDENDNTLKNYLALPRKLDKNAKHLTVGDEFLELTPDESLAGDLPRLTSVSEEGNKLYVKERLFYLEKISRGIIPNFDKAIKSHDGIKFNDVMYDKVSDIGSNESGIIEIKNLVIDDSYDGSFLAGGVGRISGTFLSESETAYLFRGCKASPTMDLREVLYSNLTDMSMMFYACDNVYEVDLSNCDTSKVTNMSEMFYLCRNIGSVDLSNCDTSKVTNMSKMFVGCSFMYEVNLSNFDTSKVTNMIGMFGGCLQLHRIDLSGNNVTRETVEKICTELAETGFLSKKTVYVSDSSKHEGLSFNNITFAYK